MADAPAVSENSALTRRSGFQPGKSGNPAGRPKKGTSWRELMRKVPVSKKREIIEKAYTSAVEGDVRWADWILRAEGESADGGGLLRELIIREYAGWPGQLE